ncbi:MAG: hypothetical protein JNK26_03270 [Candidatus Doudnabacteria bacterium]|nr:hypothetical protein [Candidatus Doudnabacteria bacterium]
MGYINIKLPNKKNSMLIGIALVVGLLVVGMIFLLNRPRTFGNEYYTFEYPLNWNLQAALQGEASVTLITGTAIESAGVIAVYKSDLPTIDNSAEAYANSEIDYHSENLADFKLIDLEQITSGKQDYPSFTYSYTEPAGRTLQQKVTIIVKDGEVYSIQYFAVPALFSQHLQAYMQVVNSFSIN